MRIVGLVFCLISRLAMTAQVAQPPAEAPAEVAGPVVYKSAGGPILLPNACTEADVSSIGLTCGENEACPTYLEVAHVEALNSNVIMAGNLHTASATLQSILLISEDGGGTWKEAHERIKAGALEGIQFIDFSTGWISGQISIGLPRDPFVLLTSDGGRTWRRTDLFAETRVGAIEDFAFQTAKRGWLLVDNRGSGEAGKYELYETQTGGSSWDLREITNKVPRGGQTPPRVSSTSARVRTDEKRGVFRVEVRAGNAWREISTFKVRVEDCKPGPVP